MPRPPVRHPGRAAHVAARWGAVALLVRPAYIATEFIVAAATTGGYSFVADSVSRLGEVGCSTAYCSPRHELMNLSFVGFGLLLTVGALLLARPFGWWVTALLVVSGLSSVATGLAPLDRDATLHALAATPLFVAQPLALLVLGARLRRREPRLARGLIAAGAVTAAAAVAFILSDNGTGAGLLERVALWPVLVAQAVVARCRLRSKPFYVPSGLAEFRRAALRQLKGLTTRVQAVGSPRLSARPASGSGERTRRG